MSIDPEKINQYADQFIRILVDYSPRLISAFLILFIGLWSINLIYRLIKSLMIKRQLEPTLANFLANISLWALRILLFVSVISKLGVETSSFVAILGAAGLAIGLSLQGSLSNFAGGVLIILFKPFKVGDFIEAQGISGTVEEIQIFVTRLLSVDNQTIFVPNGALSNGNIINYSHEDYRRADLTIGISYGSNIKLAKEIALKVMNENSLVLKDPEPQVLVRNLSDNSIDLAIRPWSLNPNFWKMRSDILEEIKTNFDESGIVIPFPQRDVYITNKL